MSIQASQNDTLSRVNRANEAVWLRKGAPVIFFFDASKRLSDCPSIHPDRRGFVAGIQPLLPLPCSLQEQHEDGEGGHRGEARD